MKGTITDFLALVSTKPELSRELIELAARHGFEFSVDELSDSELQGVVGGISYAQRGDDAQLANIDLQNNLQTQQQLIQMLSNVSKTLSDTAMSVSRKIGG
jgi:hypothetical protein